MIIHGQVLWWCLKKVTSSTSSLFCPLLYKDSISVFAWRQGPGRRGQEGPTGGRQLQGVATFLSPWEEKQTAAENHKQLGSHAA